MTPRIPVPNRETVAALIDFELSSMRLDAVRDRVIREGESREATIAFAEAVGQMTDALLALDKARYANQFPDEFYDVMNGGAW